MKTDALYKSVRMCAESDSAKIERVEEANLHVPSKNLFISFKKTCFVFSKCVMQVLQRILHLQKKHTDKTQEENKMADLWLT